MPAKQLDPGSECDCCKKNRAKISGLQKQVNVINEKLDKFSIRFGFAASALDGDRLIEADVLDALRRSSIINNF